MWLMRSCLSGRSNSPGIKKTFFLSKKARTIFGLFYINNCSNTLNIAKVMAQKRQKSIIKDILKFVIFLGIGVLLIWLFVRKLTPEEIKEIFISLKNIKYGWLFVGIAFGILSNVARTSRWIILMEPMGYKPRYLNVFMSVLIAYFANLAIPRLGEVTRCGLLTKYEKIPFAKSFGTVITERVFDMIMFLLLFVINLLIQFNALQQYLNDKIIAPIQNSYSNFNGWTILLILLIAVVVVVAGYIILWKKNPNNKIVVKINNTIKGFWDGIKSIIYIKRPFTFIFHTLLLWVCYFYMTRFVFLCLPETSHLGYDAALSSLVFSTIGVILVQGGIGIYPWIVSEVLLVYGVTSAIGYAMGWLIWLNQTIIVIIAGIISLIALPIINNHKNIVVQKDDASKE